MHIKIVYIINKKQTEVIMKNCNILVVDDEERIRNLIKEYCLMEHHKVLETDDGNEVIDIIMENNEYSIGFVILHYNTMKETADCAESVKKKIDTPNYHIVIVDNASPNGTD